MTDTAAPDTDLPSNFAEVLDARGYTDAVDVAAGRDAVYVAAFDDAGQAAVVRVGLADAAVTEVFSGVPLTMPSGVALSPDERTLLVADVASAPWNDATTSGGVFRVDLAGGGAEELGAWGAIDTPGDVTFSPDGATVYISGMTTGAEPALFSLSLATGAITPEVVGEPLADPLQLDVSPDGSRLFVVDGLAGPGGRAALLAFALPAMTPTTLTASFGITFPGGVAATEDGTTVFVSTIRASGLRAAATDGSGFEVIDTVGLFELPAGLSERGGLVYVAEASDLSGADVYSVAW